MRLEPALRSAHAPSSRGRIATERCGTTLLAVLFYALEPGHNDRRSALGLMAIKFSNRNQFKGMNKLKMSINSTEFRSRRRRALSGSAICVAP